MAKMLIVDSRLIKFIIFVGLSMSVLLIKESIDYNGPTCIHHVQ